MEATPPLNLLVVDDDEITRRGIARTLTSQCAADLPCHVATAADGAEALSLMSTIDFDCVFLDYRMPGQDGLEVLRAARAAGVRSPVVILTGEGSEQLAVEMMKAGATDYLVKGRVTPDILVRTLRHALRVRDAETRLAAAQERHWESEERFRRLVEVADVGVWIVDSDGRTTFVNAGAAAMIGYRADEILGHTPFDFMDPSCHGSMVEGLKRRRLGLRERRECLMRHRDGSPVWTIVSAAPLTSTDGRFLGSFAVLADITREKRTEQALRESEERFRRVFEDGPVGMAITGLDRRMIAVNAAFGRLVGRDPAALAGMTFDQITHPDDVSANVDLANRMRHGEISSYRMDKRYVRPDGQVVWASLTSSVLHDTAAGRPPYMLTIVEDVTERRAANEALRESEERFRKTFEDGPMGMAVVGLNHRVIAANAALGRMLGRAPRDLVGVAFKDLTHPDDVAADLHLAGQLTRGEIPSYRMEKRYVRADGGVVWGSLTVSMVRDVAGQPSYLLGMVEDISERRAAADALQASEARFRSLFESSPVSIAVTLRGVTRYANPAFLRLFGFNRPDDVIGHPIIEFVAPADRALIADRIARRDRGENVPDSYEARGLRRDGTEFPYHVRVGRMHIPEGPAQIVFVTDMTEEHRLRDQLAQAQKMESLGRLAGGIAHDFNNLLAIINGYTESLRRRLSADSNGAAGAQLDEIERAADRGARLVRQLLDFSRSRPVQTQPVDVAATVTGVCQMLRQVITHQIDIRATTDGHPAWVEADPGQVEQLLVNLALNARDAMPEGGTLTFDTRHLDVPAQPDSDPSLPAGRFVILTVSDTGAGMDESTRSRLFEPFFTTKSQGTGLGLAIVYGIVRQQNGHLSVHSEPNKGTRFEILLPAAATPQSSGA